MRRKIGATVLTALVLSWPAWAQSQTQPDASTAPAGSNDAIVKMRMEIAHANKTYDKKVNAAKKVYEHKKVEAAKERDTAIAAAHNGASQ
jgi:vancomycin permeability regulator SanA